MLNTVILVNLRGTSSAKMNLQCINKMCLLFYEFDSYMNMKVVL